MIVADKYGLPGLEAAAFASCDQALRSLSGGRKPPILELVSQSRDYPDRARRLSKLIADLSDATFVDLYQYSDFRSWLDSHSAVADPLVTKHFIVLMSQPDFRARLKQDGDLALKHLDRMLAETKSKTSQTSAQARQATGSASPFGATSAPRAAPPTATSTAPRTIPEVTGQAAPQTTSSTVLPTVPQQSSLFGGPTGSSQTVPSTSPAMPQQSSLFGGTTGFGAR